MRLQRGHVPGILPPAHPVRASQPLRRRGPRRTLTGRPRGSPSPRGTFTRHRHGHSFALFVQDPGAPGLRAVAGDQSARRRGACLVPRPTPHAVAATAAQDIGEAHRDGGACHRTDEVRPPCGPVTLDQGRAERPGRVHRRPADRRSPQPGQRDVAAHADGGQRPDLLSARRGAQDHADQAGGQDEFPQHRRCRRDAAAGQGQARAALLADQRPQQQRGQDGAQELGHDVGRDALPREVAPRREGDADRRIEVRAGDRPHEQDDGHHHQRRSHHLGAVGDRVAAEPGADHAAADGDQDQEEGAQQLREQTPSLVAVVPEVELTGNRVRLPDGPQGDLGVPGGTPPIGFRWRG